MSNNWNHCPSLQIGYEGRHVRRLQDLLMREGFDPGPADGIFGPQTRRAVIFLQRSENLQPDGIAGINTWTALGVNCRSGRAKSYPFRCGAGTFPYIVKYGDTLNAIANRFRTTVIAIVTMNAGINPSKFKLRAGQILCIPRN